VAAVAVVAIAGVAAADPEAVNNWPYGGKSGQAGTYTLAAVGDIACEPDDAENAGNPAQLKCGSPSLGGYNAEYATAQQAYAMRPDAAALPGDEQYQGRQAQRLRAVLRTGLGRFEGARTAGAGQPRVLRLCQEG
jgi:hypothetical protein